MRRPGARLAVALGALVLCGAAAGEDLPDAHLVDIAGGRLTMGDPAGDPNEVLREVEVAPFRIMRHEVTNRQFAAFVRASGHVTDPERRGFGWVWPGRWERAEGADWRHPFGPSSTIEGRGDHPVVQVSADDAAAFCRHYGLRLPTEEEWVLAARGGDRRRYPWGDAPPEDDGERRANFGTVACCAADDADGWTTTAPVGSFPSGRSPFGLLDMAGNVWEWTSSAFPGEPGKVVLKGGGWGNNPYCLRIAYRHANPPDIGLDMVGFRCAAEPSARRAGRPLPRFRRSGRSCRRRPRSRWR